MTVIEMETCNAIIRMAESLDALNIQINKHNQLLEELVSTLKEQKEEGGVK